MSDKFKNIPVEEGTKIIFSTEAKFGAYVILYQKWRWEGVTAESIIFESQDVAELSEEDIVNEVKTSPLLKENSKVTFKRAESGFVFVNFNFTT